MLTPISDSLVSHQPRSGRDLSPLVNGGQDNHQGGYGGHIGKTVGQSVGSTLVGGPANIEREIPDTSLIAWQGAFELIDAQWSLGSGRTVDFRIIEVPGEDRINPFKQYQRKRGGRVGQCFYATIVRDGESIPTYTGDLMLAGWGDSSSKGQWASYWIDEDSNLHPFAGFTRRSTGVVGQTFAAAFVILTEPGGNIDASAPAGRSIQAPRKLSADAHLMITGPFFRQWLEEKSEYTQALHQKGQTWTAETARRYVKWLLGIESLADLDRMAEKATMFHEKIRRPFAKWNGRE